MNSNEIFEGLLQNLKVGDENTLIRYRRDEITKSLNKNFRSKDSSTEHRLMVGSYGRHTAIRGVSDLDMLYLLPSSMRSDYSGETGPQRILSRIKDVLQERYSRTEVRVDQCVVRVQFTSSKFKFEIQPVFENEDRSFDYPDTLAKKWKVTKPRDEIQATRECNDRTSKNMRHLARMTRAWKNTHGVNLSGLLIDTLVHRFFSLNSLYVSAGASMYGDMVRDFFKFLADETDQSYYSALGSGQRVKVHKRFQQKSMKAYNRCLEAIEKDGKAIAAKKWREIFGLSVPLEESKKQQAFDNTEQFIEDYFPVDIHHSLTIDCQVLQKGWRPTSLRKMLEDKIFLRTDRTLDFTITDCNVERPYKVRWKVLNRGDEAERRNEIRGQIIESRYVNKHQEKTKFRGEHVVECYILKDRVVVARDQIKVPITDSDRD